MNPKKFVQSLGRRFTRQRLVENHLLLTREAREQTLPMLEGLLSNVKPNLLTQGNLGRQNKEFFQMTKPFNRAKNMFEHIDGVFNKLVDISGDIEDEINKAISKTDSAETLTYKAINLAQYVQVFQFANTYTRKLLLSTVAQINDAQSKSTIKFDSGLTGPESEWLSANAANFVFAMGALTKVAENFKTGLKDIPEVVVELSDAESDAQIHGQAKLDPFGFQNVGGNDTKMRTRSGFVFASPAFSVIYHIRMAIADWQIGRYEAAKAERQALEYRIQAINDSLAGESNPKLEAAIEVHNSRLAQLNFKINKMEEEINERT